MLIGLVVLVVLTGVPVLMPGMGVGTCSDCGPGVLTFPMCLVAVLVGLALVLTPRCTFLRARRERLPLLLRARFFDRPPQLTAV